MIGERLVAVMGEEAAVRKDWQGEGERGGGGGRRLAAWLAAAAWQALPLF